MQPGQVIIPRGSDEPKQPGAGAPQPERPLESPGPDPTPVPTPSPTPEPAAPERTEVFAYEQVPNWQSQQELPATQPQDYPADAITWTASEFVAHEKNIAWYGVFVIAGLVAATLDYLATKDKFSTGVIALAVIALAVFAARKPRTQEYALTHQGVQIGVKTYSFQDFKNFSIAQEGAIASIVFIPLRRFMPALTIYVSPDMEDHVVDFLSAILPFEAHKADVLDSLMRRIHF